MSDPETHEIRRKSDILLRELTAFYFPCVHVPCSRGAAYSLQRIEREHLSAIMLLLL